MSGDPLYVQTDGVRSYAQIHDEVVTGLSQLTGAGAPQARGVEASHGSIASAMSAALSSVLGNRQDTIQTTATNGTTIRSYSKKRLSCTSRAISRGRPPSRPRPRQSRVPTVSAQPEDPVRGARREARAVLPAREPPAQAAT